MTNGQNESVFKPLDASSGLCSAGRTSESTIGSIAPLERSAAPSPAPIAPVTSVTIWSRFKTTAPLVELEALSVPLEEVDELGVDRPVRRAPELLHTRPRERPSDRVVRDSAELGGDRARQRLQLLGQRFLEAGLGVARRVGLVDDVDGEDVADVFALQ